MVVEVVEVEVEKQPAVAERGMRCTQNGSQRRGVAAYGSGSSGAPVPRARNRQQHRRQRDPPSRPPL